MADQDMDNEFDDTLCTAYKPRVSRSHLTVDQKEKNERRTYRENTILLSPNALSESSQPPRTSEQRIRVARRVGHATNIIEPSLPGHQQKILSVSPRGG